MNMRSFLNLVEAYLHGSRVELAVGTILTPRSEYLSDWGDSFVYQTLEPYRPDDCLAHEASVFMVKDDVEEIYHSGGPREGFLCTVEPVGPVQRHNIAWLDELAERASGKVPDAGFGDDEDEDEEEPLDERAIALRYWRGVSHPERPDVFEYVAGSAKIVKVEPYSL